MSVHFHAIVFRFDILYRLFFFFWNGRIRWSVSVSWQLVNTTWGFLSVPINMNLTLQIPYLQTITYNYRYAKYLMDYTTCHLFGLVQLSQPKKTRISLRIAMGYHPRSPFCSSCCFCCRKVPSVTSKSAISDVHFLTDPSKFTSKININCGL